MRRRHGPQYRSTRARRGRVIGQSGPSDWSRAQRRSGLRRWCWRWKARGGKPAGDVANCEMGRSVKWPDRVLGPDGRGAVQAAASGGGRAIGRWAVRAIMAGDGVSGRRLPSSGGQGATMHFCHGSPAVRAAMRTGMPGSSGLAGGWNHCDDDQAEPDGSVDPGARHAAQTYLGFRSQRNGRRPESWSPQAVD